MGYGTGAIMAVPGAGRARLGLRRARSTCRSSAPCSRRDGPPGRTSAFTGDGAGDQLRQRRDLPGRPGRRRGQGARSSTGWRRKGSARRTVKYKLRDWLFSRQRYWGEPFPIVYDEDGLPHRAARVDAAGRAARGRRLLAADLRPGRRRHASPSRRWSRATDWVERRAGPGRRARSSTAARPTRCPTGPARAGTTCATWTRPTTSAFVDPEVERYWMGPHGEPGGRRPGGVDLYVGGVEHAVLHLLYARFWHKVLYDLGHVSSEEPFQQAVQPGLHPGLRLHRRPRRRTCRPPRCRGAPATAAYVTWQGEPVTREYGKMGKSLKNVGHPGRDVRRVRRRHAAPLRDVDGPAGRCPGRGRPAPSSGRPALPAAAVAQRRRRGDRRGHGRRRRRPTTTTLRLLHRTIDARARGLRRRCASTRPSPSSSS